MKSKKQSRRSKTSPQRAAASRTSLFELLEKRHALTGQSSQYGQGIVPLPNAAAEASPVALIPKIEVSHFGQDISFVATSGPVTSITVTAGGSGYTSVPTVTINANGAGSGASATAVLGTGPDAGKVVSISVDAHGAGYTGTASVTITGGGGKDAAATLNVDLSNRGTFQNWATDYINFITNSGASVAYINIGDYNTDNKHFYDYLDPSFSTDGVPWVVTDFLDQLPSGVEAGVIAYLDVANPWHLYDGTPSKDTPSNAPPPNPNFAGNTLTTDGLPTSPAPNNMYQSFQLVNAINAKQLLKGGTKFFTHYEADGEGAGAFETDTYYGFAGGPTAPKDPYHPLNLPVTPGHDWSWNPTTQAVNGWPVAGYGYAKWLWNHFMPGVSEADVATGGTALPHTVSNGVPNVVFTDVQAIDPTTWSTGNALPYQFGIIKYAQTSWLAYSPGPMVAYTENYWFGENHYMPGPGSAIAPDGTATINYVATPILNPPVTGNAFASTPKVTFNQPLDGSGNPIGTAAQGYAIMGTGSIDQTALGIGFGGFFGNNGIGSGYSTGVWIPAGAGGSKYLIGTKDKTGLNVSFTHQTGDPQPTRAAAGYIDAVDSSGAITSITITDPGEGYIREPNIVLPATLGTPASPQVLLLPEDGYPQAMFPLPPQGGTQATGYVTVNAQSSGKLVGAISGLTILDPGTGYAYTPSTAVTFGALTLDANGGIAGLTLPMTSGGSGYSSVPSITIYKPRDPSGTAPTLQTIMTTDGHSVASVEILNHGSGYSISDPPIITVAPGGYGTPSGPLAGPGGLEVTFYTTNFSPVAVHYPVPQNKGVSVPALHAPVNASQSQIAQIVVTVLGDHYDTGTNSPYYTLNDDHTTIHKLSGGPNNNGVNPNYNGAYVPAINAAGSFPVDDTGRSSLTVIESGFGYSAGAVLGDPGAGYDNKMVYPVTFPEPTATQGTKRTAKGLLNVNSNGYATGITVTDPGQGYANVDDGANVTIPAPTGGKAATAKAYLSNFPTVSLSAPDASTFIAGGGTAAQAYVITGPTDPKNPQNSDASTGYIVTGIGFTYPGVGYATVPTFTISPPATGPGNQTATVQALPALASKFSAASLPTITDVLKVPGTSLQGGANTYNWQISNGYGPGQVTGITITNGGTGYTTAPMVTFGLPANGGQRATGTAVVTNGIVTSITLTGHGYGYDPTLYPVTVQIDPPKTGTPATATATLGDLQEISPAALNTVYDFYKDSPQLLAAMFNDPLYQDVALPKLREAFYWPLQWGDFNKADGSSTDGTKTPQQAIATFSIESLNRSNTFDSKGNFTGPARTSLDSMYQSDANLSVPNTLGGTFAGLSSLSYENFVTFLNSAATIIAAAAPAGSMTAKDVTFQIYDAAFLPVEWLVKQNANRWADTNAAPVLVSGLTGSVSENAPTGTVIYTVDATDIGATVADRDVTFSIKPGTGDAASLAINPRTGEVRLLASANYEAKKTYQFVVMATDGGTPALSAEKLVTVNVADVFELPAPPQISVPATFPVVEDTRTPLLFAGVPFTDTDSSVTKTMTVTLRVHDGVIAARSGAGVTVAGPATARTFTGSLTALNNYFTSVPGRISYTAAANNTHSRLLTITLRESYGTFRQSSTATSTIDVTAVNDAPKVWAPAVFRVTEDVASSLVWPAAPAAFTDIDSSLLTVTLAVADGTLAAVGTPLVAVGGTATSLSLRGTPADLNFYVRQPGNIQYTSALDNTSPRALTVTASDGQLQSGVVSRILIQAVNDAPTQNAASIVIGADKNKPFVINQTMLKSATAAADVDSKRIAFIVDGVTAGKVEKWNGKAWAALGAATPLAARIVAAGQKLRWTAPQNAVGATAAFTVSAWDGQKASAVSSQVWVSIAAPDDNSLIYFLDDTTQTTKVPAGYGMIGEFSAAARGTLTKNGRIVGESVALKNNHSAIGFNIWPLIKDLFTSTTPVAEADKLALAQGILSQALLYPGLLSTDEFPSPGEANPTPAGGYVFWAQDFEFDPGNAPTDEVYAGVLAVMWAGRQVLGDAFPIYPVPSSSLFQTLDGGTQGAYSSDHIIKGTGSTPYLASLGLTGFLRPTPSGGEWNFLSLAYENKLIDGFFGQQYTPGQAGVISQDTKPFYSADLPYALMSSYADPAQVATGGPWSTVYNGNIPFHAGVYWEADVISSWGQPAPANQKLKPTQVPLPTQAFGLYGRRS